MVCRDLCDSGDDTQNVSNPDTSAGSADASDTMRIDYEFAWDPPGLYSTSPRWHGKLKLTADAGLTCSGISDILFFDWM